MMKNIFLFIILSFCTATIAEAQNNDINFSYGGCFTGYGDLQGKYISIGYNHKLYKRLYLYGSLAHGSMSGLSGFKFRSDLNIIGADNLHFPQLSLESEARQNELSEQYSSVGSKVRLDPPKSMTKFKKLDLGVQYYVLKGTKLGLYAEGNLSLIQLEVASLLSQSLIVIEGDYWFNKVSTGKPDFVFDVNAQEHFLDGGVGYGIGLNYYITPYVTLGANGHYNYYFNSAQNLVTWSVKLGFRLSK